MTFQDIIDKATGQIAAMDLSDLPPVAAEAYKLILADIARTAAVEAACWALRDEWREEPGQCLDTAT